MMLDAIIALLSFPRFCSHSPSSSWKHATYSISYQLAHTVPAAHRQQAIFVISYQLTSLKESTTYIVSHSSQVTVFQAMLETDTQTHKPDYNTLLSNNYTAQKVGIAGDMRCTSAVD